MSIKNNLITLVAIASLSACGGADTTVVEEAQQEAARDTRLTDAVNEPLDRAKAVEDMAMQRKADMDAKLEALEGDEKTDDKP